MMIFITGATGFIGSHIVDHIAKTQRDLSQVTLLVRDPKKVVEYEQLGAKIFCGDITDVKSCIIAISSSLPDVVIHSAALTSDWAPFHELVAVNVLGTQNIVNAIKKIKSPPFLLYLSSSGVYGRIKHPETTYIREDTPLNPKANYQKSKAIAERHIRKEIAQGTLKATILRPPNVIGPRDFTQFYKIYQAVKTGKFPLISGGKAIQTWVDVEDLVRTIFLIIKKQDIAVGQIYNVKSFEITIRDFYDQIATKINILRQPKSYSFRTAYFAAFLSETVAKFRRKSSTLNRYRVIKFSKDRRIDDSKIRRELGYVPQVDATLSFDKVITWLKNEGLE
ncbi:MAG: NAD-dependent epimerase/dehydratase family protein [Candidatus Hodarchaeota archaeon]